MSRQKELPCFPFFAQGCQLNGNLAENTTPAPPDEPIAQRLVRTVFIRSGLPLKPMPDDVDDTTGNNAFVINARNTMRTGKKRFDTLQLVFGKIKQGT